MPESIHTRLMRWRFNLFPAFRRTGGRVTYIAADLKTIRVELPLNWRTRNYVGTLFGGCMYAVVDPFYMVMFIKLLGPDFIVWDKAANIRYKKPGRTTLRAEFHVDDAELAAIRGDLESSDKVDRVYLIDLVDSDNEVCASVEKTIHFRKRNGGPHY